jgi:hypothetical protein
MFTAFKFLYLLFGHAIIIKFCITDTLFIFLNLVTVNNFIQITANRVPSAGK